MMDAVIDIGTHSILLLIAKRQEDGSIHQIDDRITITRLGEGLLDGGKLSSDAIERTIQATGRYIELCHSLKVNRIKAIGTAALRSAKNARDFTKRAKTELSLDIEVISAEKEARLTYEGSAHDFGKDILVIDIGGGSTEFIAGPPPLTLTSIPIGCIVLTEKYIHSDPISPSDERSLRKGIKSALKRYIDPDLSAAQTIIATAGTATSLMSMHFELEKYDARYIHGQRLGADDLDAIVEKIRRKSMSERRRMPGLMPDRAPVIFAGATLLQESMIFLDCDEVTVSDRGVRWGVFYEEFCGGA